jgi:hypothetical protein
VERLHVKNTPESAIHPLDLERTPSDMLGTRYGLAGGTDRMKSVTLGHSDLTVAQIGLGCMGMSEFYGPSDETQSIATLHRALELGVNLLDTADLYGNGRNERLLKKPLLMQENARRSSLLPSLPSCATPKPMLRWGSAASQTT